ncbi:hypothetical protein BCM02_110293 [Paenibacillus methanolicus]|uniref:Uncharacterized protein n=1 Tax=Paenibacillus methanolicus TaxID=582686 RepID=A0A5S5BWI1_9BACL|nr:hypothetical protein BCM02_110293 [Paenibacillus methanolicus]
MIALFDLVREVLLAGAIHGVEHAFELFESS